MPTLKQVVEESDTPLGKGFDLVIQSLIILSLISFSIETLPDLSPGWTRFLQVFEAATVIIFLLNISCGCMSRARDGSTYSVLSASWISWPFCRFISRWAWTCAGFAPCACYDCSAFSSSPPL